ncbi:hypothetical protein JXC34_06295 [Candidatus Woesearchaeota archaeon]|nr:hypothetical protein [Candidatus Woesearchaeota archaeon]
MAEEKKRRKKKTVKKKEKKENTEKKNNDLKKDDILIKGIVVLIVIFGLIVFGVRLIPKSTLTENTPEVITKEFKGYVFENHDNIWTTDISTRNIVTKEIKTYNIMFHYTPDEVEHIQTIIGIDNKTSSPELFMNSNLLYLTVDPTDPGGVVLSAVEIAKIAGNIYSLNVKSAITKEYPGSNYPIITCNNVSKTVKVIHFKLGNRTGIFNDNKGCVIVEGTNEVELLKASERLTFEMLRIL